MSCGLDHCVILLEKVSFSSAMTPKNKKIWDTWQMDGVNTNYDKYISNNNKEVAVRGHDVPLRVQEISGSDDGLDQGVGPHRLLRRRLGAGVPHGFNIAAAPHSTAWDLVILAIARVTPPIILRHLRGYRKSLREILSLKGPTADSSQTFAP